MILSNTERGGPSRGREGPPAGGSHGRTGAGEDGGGAKEGRAEKGERAGRAEAARKAKPAGTGKGHPKRRGRPAKRLGRKKASGRPVKRKADRGIAKGAGGGGKGRGGPAVIDTESHNVQEYLEAIYTLTEDGEPARTSELSKILGVKPASATGMVQKLSDAGLVRYQKYKGMTLTPEGMKLGRRMKRKHRILERFLTDVLGIKRDRVHDQACAMEHSLSDEAEAAMCSIMGHPEVCPDDNKPIPPCDRKLEGDKECPAGHAGVEGDGSKESLMVLSELEKGKPGRIAFVRGGLNVVKRLTDMGLTPDTPIVVEDMAPFKGPIQIKVRGSSLVVGRGIASKIYVIVD